jgi:hypothetical protein
MKTGAKAFLPTMNLAVFGSPAVFRHIATGRCGLDVVILYCGCKYTWWPGQDYDEPCRHVLAVTTALLVDTGMVKGMESMSNGLKLRKDKGYVVVNVESINPSMPALTRRVTLSPS